MSKEQAILKRDLINEIADNLPGFLKKDIQQSVDIILDSMADALINGQRVEIRGFGSFSVRQRKARVSKNPKTGKIMEIPQRKTLHFTMCKSLKERLIKSEQ